MNFIVHVPLSIIATAPFFFSKNKKVGNYYKLYLGVSFHLDKSGHTADADTYAYNYQHRYAKREDLSILKLVVRY